MPRHKTGVTPKRSIRIPDLTWDAAMARAEEDGTAISKVLNSRLQAYGRTLPDDAPELDPWDAVLRILAATSSDEVAGKIDYPGEDLGLAMEVLADAMRVLGIRSTRGKRAD